MVEYGSWHTGPKGPPWRLRDRLARSLGFHCWDCRREWHESNGGGLTDQEGDGAGA